MRALINREELRRIRESHKPEIEAKLLADGTAEMKDGRLVLAGDYYEKQTRIALKNSGLVDPNNIDDYIAFDGYSALEQVLSEKTQKEVIDLMTEANLRGRGGAGFPTGRKWNEAYGIKADQKYFLCNADEGDPGAYMDRNILENDPHAVIEGMVIGAYAVGASQGYIYVRAEYPVAVKMLRIAIEQAREYGLLGKNILGSGFDFDLDLRLGSGAFVCGEGTALMESIQGNRGMPRMKPPRTSHKGLWQKPTILNNVETLACVPIIFQKGVDWFRSIGTEKSPGTKVFALVGKVENAGLVEVPMGMPLNEIVNDIGGGVTNGKQLKAVQTGGPSGGCIPLDLMDTPVDFESLAKIGSIVGSGGMVVMDEDTCMVDIARFFLEFTVDESCGKCTPCRLGTRRMMELLDKITEGKGTLDDLDDLEQLAKDIQKSSLCALGQTAPNPVLSTLKYFRSEYEDHILNHKCSAGVCRNLTAYEIQEDTCKSCGICKKNCPVNAISGDKKEKIPFVIDQEACIKCGVCYQDCPFDAITK